MIATFHFSHSTAWNLFCNVYQVHEFPANHTVASIDFYGNQMNTYKAQSYRACNKPIHIKVCIIQKKPHFKSLTELMSTQYL